MTGFLINRTVRDIQIRINSLGFLKDFKLPDLVVDGVGGNKTNAAMTLVEKIYGISDIDDIFDPSGITRIHWHWTGGNYKVSEFDRKYYNDIFDNKGRHYDGFTPVLQQASYIPGRIGISHTLNANTGAIGLAVAGMFGATSSGSIVKPGQYPITWEAIDAMLEKTMYYCRIYDIKVSPWTTLSHAEVPKNIGIKQRSKWDIQVLPNNLSKLHTANDVGNFLRSRMLRLFGV